jgi:pimeloyl-ACP methyl ester carboxylesterase
MPMFTSFDGLSIAYTEAGAPDGPAVLLHHGFAADTIANWTRPGVVDVLAGTGRRVVAIDARGHGRSDKPHDPRAYADNAMTKDVRSLLDHLSIDAVDLVGYSMGSFVSASVAPIEPRVRSLVLGGVGAGMLGGARALRMDGVASALEADDPSTITDPAARAFRAFAESTGADRLALAAVQRAEHRHDSSRVGEIDVPTLVLVGDQDKLVGPPGPLVDAIPGARLRMVSGDHLTAVADPAFPAAIAEFLAEVSPVR